MMRSIPTLLILGLPTMMAYGQITITSQDMFNQIGQYYRAYANKSDVSVTGLIGSPGGPQSWDFTQGPQDEVFRFDYLGIDDGGHGGDFPKAKFAERKTEETSGAQAWLYLDQVAGSGRLNYGFYDEDFSASKPSNPFSSPIVDFPESIKYGDTWSVSTTFDTEILEIPAIINYSATAKADAYGIINQSGVGFGECLRVNELSEYVIQVDFDLEGNFQTVATYYVRNYYWLRENHGIAVQITSRELPTPPPDGFTTAAALVRMFEINHPVGSRDPQPVTDLKLTLGNGKTLLTWTKAANANSYQVEFTQSPTITDSWTVLTNTTANFIIDASMTGITQRFYRVVSLK